MASLLPRLAAHLHSRLLPRELGATARSSMLASTSGGGGGGTATTPTAPTASRSFTSSAAAASPTTTTTAMTTSEQPSTSDLTSLPPALARAGAGAARDLLSVLLQPMHWSSRCNAQLAPHLVAAPSGEALIEPGKVLVSALRALHVLRATLEADGHVAVLGGDAALAPLVREAARSCVNPNVWWMPGRWRPGTLTNDAVQRRLMRPEHQPTRRLLAARGVRASNAHRPTPAPLDVPLPRLSWPDKWLLAERRRRPGYTDLLRRLQAAEDGLHRLRPPGRRLRGDASRIRLLVVLNASRNAVALREAAALSLPVVSLVNGVTDLATVQYPVLAREGHPGFTRWFLDWMVKVANVRRGGGGGGEMGGV